MASKVIALGHTGVWFRNTLGVYCFGFQHGPNNALEITVVPLRPRLFEPAHYKVYRPLYAPYTSEQWQAGPIRVRRIRPLRYSR